MIPLFWRYLLRSFLKIFSLCLLGFIFVLLVSRFKEIGKFTALSNSFFNIILYILYQIPHILPIAIPISALIASIFVFYSLSRSHELTALRMSSLSFTQIIAPILFVSFFISLINLYMASEVTPHCRKMSRKLLYEKSSFNPILLLQRKNLSRLKHVYIDMKCSSPKEARDVLCVGLNKETNRLNLLYVKKLNIERDLLKGENITLISHTPTNKKGQDTLIVENQDKMTTPAKGLTQMMKSNTNQEKKLALASMSNILYRARHAENIISKAFVEICRRIALGFSAFTFTLLGASFSIHISRVPSKKPIVFASILALTILVSFSIGKAINSLSLYAAFMLYLLPQLGIIYFSKKALSLSTKGVE